MFILLLAILNFLVPVEAKAEPYAILVSGGGSPDSNHCDFYDDVDRANKALTGWKKINLVADGDIPKGPPNSLKCNKSRNTLKTTALVRTQTKSKINGSAKKDVLEAELNKLSTLQPGEPVLLYFTDHGGRSIESGQTEFSLSLWKENLTKKDLQKIIVDFKKAHPSNPLIFIHDHCFSGGMMDNFISPESGEIIPGVCGFSAASSTEYSYNGQSYMRKAESLLAKGIDKNNRSFSDVFNQLKYKDSIFSTPTSTSDVYLEKMYNKDKINLGRLTPEMLSCTQSSAPSGISQAVDAFREINKFLYTGNLKNQIKELSIQAEVNSNSPLEQLEALLREKTEEILEAESNRENARHAVQEVKGAWADEEIDRLYGAEAVRKLWQEGDENERITLKDGSIKTRGEMLETFHDKFDSAVKTNANFLRFIASGAEENKWSERVLAMPDLFDKIFARKNTQAGPLMRLVQTSRRAAAFDRLSPDQLEQYMNLLRCENTPIENRGQSK